MSWRVGRTPYLLETMEVHRMMQPIGRPCSCRFCAEGLKLGLYTAEEMAPTRGNRSRGPRLDVRHGRYTSYTNRRCRCVECRDAHRRFHMQWRRRNRRALRQGKVLRRLKIGVPLESCPLCGESFAGLRGLRIHKGLRHAA